VMDSPGQLVNEALSRARIPNVVGQGLQGAFGWLGHNVKSFQALQGISTSLGIAVAFLIFLGRWMTGHFFAGGSLKVDVQRTESTTIGKDLLLIRITLTRIAADRAAIKIVAAKCFVSVEDAGGCMARRTIPLHYRAPEVAADEATKAGAADPVKVDDRPL